MRFVGPHKLALLVDAVSAGEPAWNISEYAEVAIGFNKAAPEAAVVQVIDCADNLAFVVDAFSNRLRSVGVFDDGVCAVNVEEAKSDALYIGVTPDDLAFVVDAKYVGAAKVAVPG